MTPSVLTGDGREAAEAIAERLNLVTNNVIIRADVGDKPPTLEELASLENCTVSVEGKTIENWL